MANTSLDIRQSQTRVLQDQLNSAATTQMDSTLASINNELTPPGRLIAQATPSLVVTVGTGTVVNPNTSKNRLIPFIANTYVNFAGGTITFPSASGNVTVSAGPSLAIVMGASQFLAITVQLDSTASLQLSAGTASSSLAAALSTASPGSSAFLSLGVIVIQSNVSSVIQSVTNAMIYQFGSGTGGSGSGSGGTGDDLASLQFQADITDLFPESPSQSSTTINNASGFTNASYNAGKNMYQISYDASKTASGSTTTITMSANPSFTVVAGDVIWNQATGEVKKIITVTTQSSYVIESAFAETLTSQAVTVSQAVHTKDIYNLAVDANGNTLASAFGGTTFSEIAVFYKDNNVSGNNMWSIGSTNCAYIASPNNSTWTNIQDKTLITSASKYPSTILPSAGTSLYIRFFSFLTSGSGVVNLLMYKAYMQKAVASAQGGILWAAYGTTNNSTTSIGCTISTPSANTLITLTGSNQYAVGVNTGQTYGSVDVYLNGQLIPRYVAGSVPSTDSYYTEVSGTVIQLDRDYSSLQVEVQIIQRTQIVDASTTNTTNISAIQSGQTQGFQGFTSQGDFIINATSTVGTPAAGTFYSSIVGRASMPDLSQDVKPRFGIERLMTQQISPLQSEFGSNGEIVWSTPNDLFGQIRFVGFGLSASVGVHGQYIGNSNFINDYVEIVFYGTGLNLINNMDGGSYDLRATVDGGVEGGNLVTATYSAVLDSRNYGTNQIIPIVSGLTLGIHTVKIRQNTVTSLNVYGFEIINQNVTSTNLSVNSGIGYIGGQKLVNTSQLLQSYASTVTGTKGGRVLVYQSSTGAIGTAFTPTNASIATLSSTDHTNEEIARIYHWREFSAGRTDDLGAIVASGTNYSVAFVLDDDSTSLNGTFWIDTSVSPNLQNPSITGTGNGGTSIYFTFVGTGLDVVLEDHSTAFATRNPAVTIDGVSTGGTIAVSAQNNIQKIKVCSGLSYGTHIVQFIAPTSAAQSAGFKQFIVYQPKTPALPSGAMQIGSYNVLGNYVPITGTANANNGPFSQGILMKTGLREVVYVGSWSISTFSQASNIQPFNAFGGASGGTAQYVFFGTGFEMIASYNTSANATITIDGTLYTGAATATNSTTWTAGTGTWTASSGGGGQLQISGLSLGLHKVLITNNSSNALFLMALNIITPIYSPKPNLYSDLQNTLPIGSNAISDDRQIQPVKGLPAQKAWAQAVGINTSFSTTSTSFVPLPDMSLTLKTGGAVQVNWNVCVSQAGGQPVNIQLYVDGVATGPTLQVFNAGGGSTMVPLSAGVHKFDLLLAVSSGTCNVTGTDRILTVKEL